MAALKASFSWLTMPRYKSAFRPTTMADTDRYQLKDNAPQVYEQGVVPLMFRPLAELTFKSVSLDGSERVLDAACGTGIVTRVAMERFSNIRKMVGVDLNPGMLEVAGANTPKTNIPIEWQQGDICALPFPDGSFDVVLCQQSLQFIPDKAAALREMRRVLADNGKLVFTVWIESPYHTALADALTRHVSAEAAKGCLSPYALHDARTVRKLVSDAGFRNIDMRLLEVMIRVSPSSADSLFETIAARSSFAREISEVRATLYQEVSVALQAYRNGNDFVIPWKSHLVQTQTE